MWEKEKRKLATGIFSFIPQCFPPFQNQICKCFYGLKKELKYKITETLAYPIYLFKP